MSCWRMPRRCGLVRERSALRVSMTPADSSAHDECQVRHMPSRAAILAFIAAMLIGADGVPVVLPGTASAAPGAAYPGCHVVDGDTMRCGAERIRLLGIDAPELSGHCARGRVCAPGNPYASRKSLEAGRVAPLRITRVGTDRYGRTLALVAGKYGDLSCWQLTHKAAIYKPAWDNGGRVATLCPAAAR